MSLIEYVLLFVGVFTVSGLATAGALFFWDALHGRWIYNPKGRK